jgi:hypothetical protein
LFKEVNTEAAEKLDAILGFVEQPGNSSDACGRLPLKSKKKGLQMSCNPLSWLVAWAGFEPKTFGFYAPSGLANSLTT